MLGNLDWSAIPFDEPIPLIAGGVVLVAILAVLAWVVVVLGAVVVVLGCGTLHGVTVVANRLAWTSAPPPCTNVSA